MDSSNPFSMGQAAMNPFNAQSMYPQTTGKNVPSLSLSCPLCMVYCGGSV